MQQHYRQFIEFLLVSSIVAVLGQLWGDRPPKVLNPRRAILKNPVDAWIYSYFCPIFFEKPGLRA
ncbi:hypothetical protein [Microcoleus sp. herbarium13]|uniref:hypothetical protein n=1 Tax=Microcoleus sp. herbarium13 TaxID=3055438 RepID=UPI002FD73F3F